MPAHTPRGRRRALGLLTAALLAASTVAAQPAAPAAAPAQPAWKPSRTVSLIVPYSPGGGVDAMARQVARELQAQWGQTVLVENVPGAGGLLGTRRVLDAAPDGHTLLVQIPSLLVIRHTPMYKGADPASRLLPVSAYALTAGVYAAHAAVPARNWAELKRHCNAAPKPCSFGTTENIARVRLKMLEAEIPSMIVVNYKGGGQLVNDLIGGNVDIGMMGYTAIAPHVKAGTVKVLMSTGASRSPTLPEVQTTVEAGLPHLVSETWYGLFAPQGTPPAVVMSIAAGVREAVKSEATRTLFASLASTTLSTTPEDFAKLVHDEDLRISALVKKYPLD
ncbi:MAG: tripartite tricarboxylate transporter substrate binding protein [Pseudomonadota bacterium]